MDRILIINERGVGMGFIELQFIVFATIILSGILGGKKGVLIASAVWFVSAIIMMYSNVFAVIQIIIVGVSFQVAMLIGMIKDYSVKRKNIWE